MQIRRQWDAGKQLFRAKIDSEDSGAVKWIAKIHFTCRGQKVKTKMKSMKKDWYKNPIRLYTISEISKIFSTLGMSVCKSYADYTGKPSSDHDIQLMVYSVQS